MNPVSTYKQATSQLKLLSYINIIYGILSFIASIYDLHYKTNQYVPYFMPYSIAVSTSIIGTLLTTGIMYTGEIQTPAIVIQSIGSTWCLLIGIMTPLFSKYTSLVSIIINILGGGMNYYGLYLLLQLKTIKQMNKRV